MYNREMQNIEIKFEARGRYIKDAMDKIELSGNIYTSEDTLLRQCLRYVLPAYALTVHKAQGSEYDTIILPLSSGATNMLTHNLLYTAISRAKKKVILIGSKQALETAMQKKSPDRHSMLVSKTRMILHRKSA